MKKSILALVIIFYVLYAPLAPAKNLGVIGPVYPIAETDFLQWVQTRLQEKIQSGEFARWQEEQVNGIKNLADRPTPVMGLTPALQDKSWLYDPTLTLTHDLFDAQGNLRFPAGTRLNPLAKVTWTKTLVFYDGDDVAQVNWAMHLRHHIKGEVILILTQGSVSAQTKKLKQRVYFDQGGQLVQRFGITHLPASVTQKGRQLRVTEVKL